MINEFANYLFMYIKLHIFKTFETKVAKNLNKKINDKQEHKEFKCSKCDKSSKAMKFILLELLQV